MVPTTVALRRMLSWVPTPIALRRLHLLWFRFRHKQVWVWAPCWPLTDFARGNAPWSTCLKKRGKTSHESLTHGVVKQTNNWNTPHFTLWVAASRARGPLSAAWRLQLTCLGQTNKWNTPHFTLWVAAPRARGPLSAG